TGWVSSRVGAKRTLIAGLVLIVVFAAAAGSSDTISGIVGFRAGWGLGNALFIATSLAVIVASASGGVARGGVRCGARRGVGVAGGHGDGAAAGGCAGPGQLARAVLRRLGAHGDRTAGAPAVAAADAASGPEAAAARATRRPTPPQPGHHERGRPALQLGV